jgi:hypothetical protein
MAKPTPKNPLWEQTKPKQDNPATVKKLEEAFALDCTVWEACFYAEISHQTYYNLLEQRPELIERFKALREKPVLLARQVLINGINWKTTKDKTTWVVTTITPPNPELALKYLERKRKNEFALRTEHTWEGWGAIKQEIVVSNDIASLLKTEKEEELWE